MATRLKRVNNRLGVTRFAGGPERGVCLQLTGPDGWVQLTRDDAAKLAKQLVDFVNDPMEMEEEI
jgi:hypothetical protein